MNTCQEMQIGGLAVELFHNGDVRHDRGCRGVQGIEKTPISLPVSRAESMIPSLAVTFALDTEYTSH